ncbi:hypothetical protein NFI96_003332 [Prochilodus magdalenae]|nr:hypothetical protein NFI96_003332 [Prochilodus magdalenae]
MILNGSYGNGSALEQRPPWVATTLGCFLIFTIVVDILGNLLVIFSVYRNKKLRNAETIRTGEQYQGIGKGRGALQNDEESGAQRDQVQVYG